MSRRVTLRIHPSVRGMNPWGFADLWILVTDDQGKVIGKVKPLEIEMYPPDESVRSACDMTPGPALTIETESQDQLQLFMDDLWRMGIRPKDIGTPGHLAATQEHLKHVSGLLDMVLPLALRNKTNEPTTGATTKE